MPQPLNTPGRRTQPESVLENEANGMLDVGGQQPDQPALQFRAGPFEAWHVPLVVQQHLFAPHEVDVQEHLAEVAVTVHLLPLLQMPPPEPPVHAAPTVTSVGQSAGQVKAALMAAAFGTPLMQVPVAMLFCEGLAVVPQVSASAAASLGKNAASAAPPIARASVRTSFRRGIGVASVRATSSTRRLMSLSLRSGVCHLTCYSAPTDRQLAPMPLRGF